jgi:hypothetical protein
VGVSRDASLVVKARAPGLAVMLAKAHRSRNPRAIIADVASQDDVVFARGSGDW